jgi:hypothetical protein
MTADCTRDSDLPLESINQQFCKNSYFFWSGRIVAVNFVSQALSIQIQRQIER